jgi:hypothetical protein
VQHSSLAGFSVLLFEDELHLPRVSPELGALVVKYAPIIVQRRGGTVSKSVPLQTKCVSYRFARAADATRFAIEDLPAESLSGASLEVGEDQFDARVIRGLYEHTGYPLERREPAARISLMPDTGREQDPPRQKKTVSWRRS